MISSKIFNCTILGGLLIAVCSLYNVGVLGGPYKVPLDVPYYYNNNIRPRNDKPYLNLISIDEISKLELVDRAKSYRFKVKIESKDSGIMTLCFNDKRKTRTDDTDFGYVVELNQCVNMNTALNVDVKKNTIYYFKTYTECVYSCEVPYFNHNKCLIQQNKECPLRLRYYFHATLGLCVPGIIRSCSDRMVGYGSEQACNLFCDINIKRIKYRCNYPLVSGSCSLHLPIYGYNVNEDRCQPFEYSGCSGNINRFFSIYACESICNKSLYRQSYSITTSNPECSYRQIQYNYDEVEEGCFAENYKSCSAMLMSAYTDAVCIFVKGNRKTVCKNSYSKRKLFPGKSLESITRCSSKENTYIYGQRPDEDKKNCVSTKVDTCQYALTHNFSPLMYESCELLCKDHNFSEDD